MFLAGTKLRRLRSAIDANLIGPPFPTDYMDVHVIAGALKSYLRDLPDPLLTYRLYDEFVSAALRPGDDKRKNAILNAVNQLPNANYYNLRYLTKFLSLLAQKSQHNKMSSQNIAIVMSPNLLWPPDANEIDYVTKVNSSAAVNTIVEMLVSDWNFFFDGEVDFHVTMTRDDLFPDNGGFAYDRDPDAMTKSLHATGSLSGLIDKPKTHSRSSSHDTSQILYGDQIKRSQSSSSLSDNNSSPPQSSPKLPVRRKHNKQAAPTPPDAKFHRNHLTGSKSSLHKINDGQTHHQPDDDDPRPMHPPPKSDSSSQTGGIVKPPLAIKRVGSNDNLSKPEKPPRPTLISAECQTLNRHSYRSKGSTDRISSVKPVALPRNFVNVAKSNENLTVDPSDDASDEPIVFREKEPNEKPDKPAIPERPVTLMRPPSFNKIIPAAESNHNSNDSGLKKNSSFRGVNSQQQQQSGGSSASPKGINGGAGNGSSGAVGGSNSSSHTTLERTHIYNVDKKQVAIIDVGDNLNNNANRLDSKMTTAVTAGSTTAAAAQSDEKSQSTAAQATDTTAATTTHQDVPAAVNLAQVPPSPRGFDPKIKRPQIPAPPPPINRPKSDSGDSTHL